MGLIVQRGLCGPLMMACAMLSLHPTHCFVKINMRSFLASVPETLAKLRDLNSKELEVLLPTSFKLLSDEEFVRMSKNDHEIGYAIINAPGLYVVPGINDSAASLNGNAAGQK